MSIIVTGTLSVQRIPGVYGEFSVGKLDCEIGVLNIKDPKLDQFETGTYQGKFGLTRVWSHGYAARTGCFIVETRAQVDEYVIFDDSPGQLNEKIALQETDPLETAAPKTKPLKTSEAKRRPAIQPAMSLEVAPKPLSSGNDLAALFSELWPLGEEVRLDPISMRSDPESHRKRCQYLKEQGYRFKAASQSWQR